MRFNDRSMALLGVPDLPTEAFKHAGDRRIKPQGGGGQPTQTQSTNYQTNIPEYAKPYVETMLGATQKQLFQGTPTEGGGFDITGFQPYKAYGGTYDEAGNQTGYDPSKGIAGFQPMQQQAQQGIAGMQVPGQYGQGMDITGAGVRGAIGTAGQGVGLSGLGYETANTGNRYAQQATNPNAMQAYMSPYMQNVVDVQQREAQRQADIAGTQRNAQAVQAGAFGGSRQAIMDAEAARNLAQQKGDIQATGLQSAYQQAQQAQQYGANLGLQGMQAGMAGVGAGIGAQQAGYGQAMQGAGQLAGLGGQQLAAQQGIYNLQNQIGAQQQSLEQQKLNQAQQDYANAQQYPLMQLGTMSNMIRGLPMQASTTQQYQAQPSALTQGIGAIGAGTSLYNAFNPTAKAKGGIISYNVGGEIESDLEDADDAYLQKQLKESSSPSVKRMAQRILRERQMEGGPRMAGGGIIAFAGPTEENNQSLVTEPTSSEILQQRVMQGKPTGDVMAQQAPVTAQAPAQPPAQDTAGILQAASNVTPLMKSMVSDASKQEGVSVTDRYKEIQDAKRAAGVEAPGVEQRAKLMAERANAEDEANRNRWLRSAEFFARWGSTPGPTLVAGMQAVRAAVPDVISDEKEAKRVRMEIDKSIAGLDEATRLEKKGDIEAATAIKTKWADRVQALNMEVAKLQEQDIRNERSTAQKEAHDKELAARSEAHDIRVLAGQKEIEQMRLKAEQARAGAASADRKDQAKWAQLSGMYRAGEAEIDKINGVRNSKSYMDNKKIVDDAEKLQALDPEKKIPPHLVGIYPKAVQAIRDAESDIQTRKNTVQSRIRQYEKRTFGDDFDLSTDAPKTAPSNPGGAAKRGGEPRTPLSSFQR